MNIQKHYIKATSQLESLQNSHASVVISPHPDDDVIGMGGVMALKPQNENFVTVCMTNGAGSLRCCGTREEIINERKREAIKAIEITQNAGAFFLGAESRELKDENSVRNLKKLLIEIFSYIRPNTIYMTAPFEKHTTHILSSSIVTKVLQEIQYSHIDLYGYPVWGPIYGPDHYLKVFDITNVIDIKENAILAHKGEVSYKDYHRGVRARNFYHAIFHEAHNKAQAKYLELFLDMSELLKNPQLTLKTFAKTINIYYINSIYKKD